jgi:hypothetical protein
MCKLCIFEKKFATNESRTDFKLMSKHVVLMQERNSDRNVNINININIKTVFSIDEVLLWQ